MKKNPVNPSTSRTVDTKTYHGKNGGRVGQRVQIVRQLMGAGISSSAVQAKLAEEWKVDTRTVRSYIQTVREERKRDWEEENASGELFAELLLKMETVYQKAMADKRYSACVQALERIAEWAGISKKRVELSGPGGAPIETVSASIDLRGLSEELLAELGAKVGLKPE